MDQFPSSVAEQSVMEKGFSWVQRKASRFTNELMSFFITTSMFTQQEVKASSAQENPRELLDEAVAQFYIKEWKW